ncbi:MAG: dicarboxylate/amino acid:cation symporter [Pseudomonadota bacterium]
MNLANKVLLALVLGIVVGLVLNISGTTSLPWVQQYLIGGVFHVVGDLFINALKMLVVPLVLFSLIPGIIGIGDIRLLGRIGGKAFGLYMLTTAVAIATAILFAVGFGIGEGMSIPTDASFVGKEASSFADILINIVPSNPIQAMANSDMLAIIFFSIFFGIALLSLAKESAELITIIEQINATIMRMVTMVMWFAPYAVFCLVGKAVAELGLELLTQLLGYFLVLVAALVFHAFVTQMALLKATTGLSIRAFIPKIRTAQLFAFSTSSSGATIPVTLRTVQERLGVDRAVSSFSVPFGATINMDGTAMMQGAATVFVANLYGIHLGIEGYVTVVLTAVLASIGTAAVPAVGVVMLTIVFDQVGLPIEALGLIYGVDRLLDMLRTAVNVTGDAVVTTIVAKSENRMEVEVYNDPKAGMIMD